MSDVRRCKMTTVAYILIPLFGIGCVLLTVFILDRLSNAWVKPWFDAKRAADEGIQELEDYANWGRSKDDEDR